MIKIERAVELVREWVPDLDEKIGQFEVGAIDIDDELIEAFCEELALVGGDLQAGLDSSDDEQVHRAAHSMKGMGGTMGLPEISVLAREIELALRADERERFRTLCQVLIAWVREFITTG